MRDADVHCLVFPRYITNLVPSERDALAPMQAWLDDERQRTQRELATVIASHRFRTRWLAWLRFVHTQAPRSSRQPAGRQALSSVAPGFIAVAARRVVRRGRRIDESSPPEAFHALRKSCKNIRYLIDAYGFTITNKSLKQTIKHVKNLQNLLGEYQDLDVHQRTLRDLHERMMREGTLSGDAHHAMESLLTSLSERAQRVRANFPPAFAAFRKIHPARSLEASRPMSPDR